MESKSVVLKPRMSEKTYAMSQSGVYVFDVPSSVNKHEVARAVQAQFNVTVKGVTVAIVKGKKKRSARKGARPVMGRRSDIKKAYVTLKDGDTLPIFATEEDKKADKKAGKEKK